MYFRIYLLFLALFAATQPQHCQLNAIAKRQKRWFPALIFPPTSPTRIQLIVGIGIPLEDLLYEAMTTGYVLKAEYFLADSVEKLFTISRMPFTARQLQARKLTKFERFLARADEWKRYAAWERHLTEHRKVLSSYRWSIYKALEGLAERIAPAGRACVLKSICEAAETPFHYRNGLFGELLHILLTPSSSMDELSEHADNEYFYAESMGRSGADCSLVFRVCKKSLLEHFSNICDQYLATVLPYARCKIKAARSASRKSPKQKSNQKSRRKSASCQLLLQCFPTLLPEVARCILLLSVP
ncbi:uncharacterized protein LOC118740112 [Rhagoletis pomonella]|uniref:uncharacterized protein LOC118740112 n=1 Tax=Rhagoletis pomonella TaxID=28610 RepID=UPI001782E4ED|nr:uncharacterized protein LOC118740112 [Rhagoletis pomonella]